MVSLSCICLISLGIFFLFVWVIIGFTAWSSSREPRHVFELLESIFHTFDEIARKKEVFKVDTVGDCYCCVTGVPIPREDHAVVMADFAREILAACNVVTSTLEVQLGPETADLSMRAGIHSGPGELTA